MEVTSSTPDSPDASTSTSSESPAIPWGWLRATVYLVVVALAVIFVEIVFQVAVSMAGYRETAIDSPIGVLEQFLQLCVVVLVTLLFRKLVDRRSFVSLGFNIRTVYARDFLSGLGFGLVLILMIYGLLAAMDQISVVYTGISLITCLRLVVLMIIVALTEEIAVRGYILNNLLQSFGRFGLVAVLISSLLFGGLHLLNPNVSWPGLANIVLAGMILGLYYNYRRNLWFPIGLHFSWNFVQGPVLGSPVSGKWIDSMFNYISEGQELLTGGSFGLEASLLTTCAFLVALLSIHLIYRQGPIRPISSTATFSDISQN